MATVHPNGYRRTLLFPIGALVFSESVDRLMREGRLDPMPYVQRHTRGDWGEVADYKWQANNAALTAGERLESMYLVHRELRICVVTEADRSATRILLTTER
ncbi:hypothetical protein [Burkholderia seminalis]|uniref:hypothetical protein n=1 Tax=Burkholderia seminalis TaxID=488731 RepID=UPI0019077560|nr:hypothetical protein [Burkholderia seminalis]MBJ9965680.1 hypothetical protein [Burkholderia seminalis]MDN7588452.1 hypothetical protein [Burkholderia seminalis]